MSGSGRRFKSPWDMKEEAQQTTEISENNALTGKECHSGYHVGHSPKWSDLEVNNVSKSKDRSAWPSSEPLQGNSDVQEDDSINRDGLKTFTAPAFDGRGCRNNSQSPDDSWSLSHRGRDKNWGRGRSRSRSRSRGRGRSRSRSRSRSRGRGRVRDRSRSPFLDHRRESHGWIDRRRSGSRISSQPCRDFAVGKCRRGRQCRFFHQDNLNFRDGDCSDDDHPAERWRSRPEHGAVLKYGDYRGSADSIRNNVSDGYGNYYEEDEPPRDNSKDTITCKDFLRGRCHRGASCRYPHHGASGGNYDRGYRNASYDRGNRNASYDRGNRDGSYYDDCKRQPNRSGKVPCKFFAVGKCNRDDCRFSHDGPSSRNFGGSSRDDRRGHNLDDKNKFWNGPTWDDETSFPDITKPVGWGDSSVGNSNFHDPITGEEQTDDRWGHSLENDSRMLGDPGWKDEAAESDGYLSPHLGGGGNGADMGTSEFMGMKKLIDGEDHQLNPEGSQLQNLDGISMHVPEQNIMQEASGRQLATIAMPPKVSESSYIQQHHGQGGDNIAIAYDSNALNEVKVSENITHPVLVPGQNFNQSGDSMDSQPPLGLSGTDESHHMLSPNPLNGNYIDLNESVQHLYSPLNLQNQTQIHHKEAVEPPEMLEFRIPQVTKEICQKVVTSEQVSQITDLPASLTRMPQNGQLTQPYAVLTPPNATGLVHSLPSSARVVPPIVPMVVPPVDPMVVPSIVPMVIQRNQARLLGHGESMEPSNPDNINKPPGFLSSLIEQENQMPLERSSPISNGDHNSSKLHESGFSEEEDHKSPKLKQQEPVANLEVNGNKETVAVKFMQEQENIHSGSLDAHRKVEEDSSSKDEKAMRVFKIALVEFVKEILKPTWKEGQMSREVHKTVVKKVVDKVTSTIQGVQIPKTQEKIDQYLSFSKPKITKLVQAYVDRFLKS